MSSVQVQMLKWSFPAFALVLGLLWYKRRRVDRVDPGGVPKLNGTDDRAKSNRRTNATTATRIDDDKNSKKRLEDIGGSVTHSDEPTSSVEDMVRSPRKISNSLDIPLRKGSTSQIMSLKSGASLEDQSCDWYNDGVESVGELPSNEIQMGSNPKLSSFEVMSRSYSTKSPLKFENVVEKEEEEEQDALLVTDEAAKETDLAVSEQVVSSTSNQTPERSESLGEKALSRSTEAKHHATQAISERDSANHSPISGVLDGSVTDEARSEGSADSGKGGSIKEHIKDTQTDVYEFAIPEHLVGRLIGQRGNFLYSIRSKAKVRVVVKRHPTLKNEQICAIEGSLEGIKSALALIKKRFPEKWYPNLTDRSCLQATAEQATPFVPAWSIIQLSLIEGVNNDVFVCNIAKPNHLFLQLTTHPSYPYLRSLDQVMTDTYNSIESSAIESAVIESPDELISGSVVAVNYFNKWVRVIIHQLDPTGKRHVVRFADHGGYWTFSNAELRKMRADLLALPFQAIEVYLANIQPRNGHWSQEAYDLVHQICQGVVGQAQIEGYVNTSVYVNLYLNIYGHGVISLADELIARGYADPIALEDIIPEDELLQIA